MDATSFSPFFQCLILTLLSVLSSTWNPIFGADRIDNMCSFYLSDKDKYEELCYEILNDLNTSEEELSIATFLSTLLLNYSSDKDSIDQLLETAQICQTKRCRAYHLVAQCRIPLSQEKGREAVNLALDAIQLFDPAEDAHMYMMMHQSAATCYYWMSDYERAGKYVLIALEKAQQLKNPYAIGAAYDLLANGWTAVDEVKADSFRHLFYEATASIEDLNYKFSSYLNKAWALQEADKDDSARVYFQSAFDLARDSGEVELELEALTYLAENSFWQKDFKKTIAQYEKALTYPKELMEAPGASRAYDFWSEAEAELGNYKNAYEYLRQYKEIDDRYWDLTSREQTYELEAKYESIQKEAQLAQQQLQLEKRTAQRNLAYAGGLGLLMIGGFFFYRYRQKQLLSKSRIENLEKQQQLIALDYMVQGQEEERKRIAQDLHDGLGGLLSSARMQMQVIHREMEKFSGMDLFTKAETMIDTACTEVRRIAHDMMPGALIDLGLIDAVEDLLIKTSAKHSLQYQFSHPEEIEISDLQSIQLYRIVQEIINNTIKHAGANYINCKLSDNGDAITLTISDDGVGFQMTEALKKDGIGLQNIQSRVRYLNGTLDFSSEPQGVTTYNIVIPK